MYGTHLGIRIGDESTRSSDETQGIWLFLYIGGPFPGRPSQNGPTILGSILGPLNIGNHHIPDDGLLPPNSPLLESTRRQAAVPTGRSVNTLCKAAANIDFCHLQSCQVE